MFTFARQGTNFVLEFSAEDSLGQAISSGLTVTASIRKETLYWDDTPDTFSSTPEVQLTLAFVINGLYRFTSVGGAELTTQKYEIHLTVTGHEAVNKNTTFTETIRGGISTYPDGFINYDASGPSLFAVFEKDGTFNNSCAVANNAVTLANTLGSQKINVRGAFSPSLTITDFLIRGVSVTQSTMTFVNTIAVGVVIEDCSVTSSGLASGNVSNAVIKRCLLLSDIDWDNSNGIQIIDSLIKGVHQVLGVSLVIDNSASFQGETLTLQALSAGSKFFVKKFVGNLSIISETFGNTHYIHMMGGTITFDSSNTSGSLILQGYGELVDNSGSGFTVDKTAWTDSSDIILSKYPEGGVHFDSGATANTGTTLGEDGISDNKVTDESSARQLAVALGTYKILVSGPFLLNDFGATMTGYEITGLARSETFTGSATVGIGQSVIKNLSVQGGTTFAGEISDVLFEDCMFLNSGFTATDASDLVFRNCIVKDSFDTSSTIELIGCRTQASGLLTLNSTNVSFWKVIRHVGDIKVTNTIGAKTHYIHMQGGAIEIDSSNTLGSTVLTGWGTLTDGSGGGHTVDVTGWQPLPVTSLGANLVSIKGTALSETTAGRLAANFGSFYDNNDATTTKVVDDVGGGGGGVDITSILGTNLTESGSGDMADAFTNFFNVGTALKDINDIVSASEVNTEVSDVLKVDTIAELGIGAPVKEPTFESALMLLYMSLRNANITDTSKNKIHNDAGTVIAKCDVSEVASVFTKAKFVSG